MIPSPNSCERADMSDSEKPGTILETRELWHVEFREDATYPWVETGTHKSDWADILRVYDYSLEHHSDKQHQIIKTDVTVRVEDPERLRELLAKESAGDDPAGVESA